MKAAGIYFTREGQQLSVKVRRALQEICASRDLVQSWYGKGRYLTPALQGDTSVQASLRQWTGEQFAANGLVVYIGAVGIAVRAIAPFLKDKRTDPAVIVLDEQGQFCISLLSGHIGGANAVVAQLAEAIGSTPVITTATDGERRFAVDVYAAKNHMVISNMTYAKEVSAAILAGEPVGFYTHFPVSGNLPEGLVWSGRLDEVRAAHQETRGGTSLGIYISPSYHRASFDHTLWLIPKCLVLGIGCKMGTSAAAIERFVQDTLRSYSLYPEAIGAVASIDAKKEEPGLLQFCALHDVALQTYSAEELMAVPGAFSGSAFVRQQVGADNVCERSAVRCGGQLIIPKTKGEGMTLAVSLKEWTLQF